MADDPKLEELPQLPPSSVGKCYSPAKTGTPRCVYHKHFQPKEKLPTRCTNPQKLAAAGVPAGEAMPLTAREIADMQCQYYTPDTAENQALIEQYQLVAAQTGAALEIPDGKTVDVTKQEKTKSDRAAWEKALGVEHTVRIGKELLERYPQAHGPINLVPKLTFTYIDNVSKQQGSLKEFIARAIKDDEIAVLIGHLGSGKTTGILQVASEISAPTVVINCDGQLTVDQVIGSRVPAVDQSGNTVLQWVDAPLLSAYRNGYVAIVDDFTFTGSEVFSAIFGLMTNSQYQVLSTGEIIQKHPMFRLFLTTNPPEYVELYPNRQQTDAAFQSRIQARYWVDYLPPAQERKAMKQAGPQLTEDTLDRMQRVIKTSRKYLDDGKMNFAFSTRHAVQWAKKTARIGDMMRAAHETFVADLDSESKLVMVNKILDSQSDVSLDE